MKIIPIAWRGGKRREEEKENGLMRWNEIGDLLPNFVPTVPQLFLLYRPQALAFKCITHHSPYTGTTLVASMYNIYFTNN